eukprot:1955467-Rhodomonas_salina.1
MCVRERESERVCVCMCERARECVCVCAGGGGGEDGRAAQESVLAREPRAEHLCAPHASTHAHAFGATKCVGPSLGMVLRNTWYSKRVWCYETNGTEKRVRCYETHGTNKGYGSTQAMDSLAMNLFVLLLVLADATSIVVFTFLMPTPGTKEFRSPWYNNILLLVLKYPARLRVLDAMSGTEIAYGAARPRKRPPSTGKGWLSGYAMRGTGIPYAATQCAVLSERLLLHAHRALRYRTTLSVDAMCGTDLAYGATRSR